MSRPFGGDKAMDKAIFRRVAAAGVAVTLIVGTAPAQVRTVDPNAAMQADLAPVPSTESAYGTQMPADPPPAAAVAPAAASAPQAETGPQPNWTGQQATTASNTTTYQQNDVLNAAEGVFGRGAEGLARIVQRILRDQGEPNAYIAGHEAGGAFAIGLRYGSGTMFHKVEGQRPVYWTGPSVGFDFGANGSKTFVLVYNLYDSQELYHRFPAAEGTAYVIGGFTASYLRRGDVVLIPIRLGVGWRLGVNVGYMKFSERSKLMPF